ncbi:hypothetical protein GG804_24940 [Sphingomonas histidinilytica]|uniref:hypothetical protein n=1 Tax=Rhizorhabdus histidinilytica TaxID=439228 RepID=UPI001ADBD284|nr:hypothetical protein [Rhizorhabdus histidinilytica]MBO9380018.1 hypothetical protein [Rhizorhabdus histidinilytica]
MIDQRQPRNYKMHMADEKSRPFQMRVSEDWLALIDDWRRGQPDLPARAEAIRRLVQLGLDAHAAGRVALQPPGVRTFHQDPKDYGSAKRSN